MPTSNTISQQQDERAQQLIRIVTDYHQAVEGLDLDRVLFDIFHGYLGSDLANEGNDLVDDFFIIRQILVMNKRIEKLFQTSNMVS